MKKWILLFSATLATLTGFYLYIAHANEKKAEKNFTIYCGSCHIPPNPGDLTKQLWKENILPEMGARLGMKTEGYDPYKNTSYEEQYLMRNDNIYPANPVLTEKQWKDIRRYVIKNALKENVPEKNRKERDKPMTQFSISAVSLDDAPGAFVTCLHFDVERKLLLAGNAFGNLYGKPLNSPFAKMTSISSPVVSIGRQDSQMIVTGIGKMPPTELKTGEIFASQRNGVMKLIIDTLRRPVFTAVADLNKDGKEEFIVCEYGNRLGQLTLYYKPKDNDEFASKMLLDGPGTIRVIIEDMNDDGKKDLVVLRAQGDEGVTILYQRDNLRFVPNKVIRLSPVYGTSWFELVDYDGDGDKDIAIANGDNADQSYMLKNYHGLRIFINDGKSNFSEKFFYPIYGATRVVADDFDQDGDVDFAVCAFFPDFDNNPEESFVYLENTDPDNFQFKASTFKESAEGRWLVMEKGDIDHDGDTDLVLGSFIHSPAPTPESFKNRWQKEDCELMILKNNLKKEQLD